MASSQKRIAKELSELSTSPPEGITVSLVDESDLFAWKASVKGPEGSPFAGGTFHLLLTLPSSYPFKPPTLSFLTKIYHPNVSNDVPANAESGILASLKSSGKSSSPAPPPTTTTTTRSGSAAIQTPASTPSSSTATTAPSPTGLMCLGPLRPDAWKPSTKISAILEFARQLMREPNPDDAVETRIADEYKNDRKNWEKEAKEWTKRYAMKK